MKREIKFRAWYKEECIMAYGDKDIPSDVDYWDGVELSKIELLTNLCDDDDYDLMQSTGLKDKNGKEIYEGDILNIHGWWSDNPKLGISTMVWCNDSAGWRLDPMHEMEDAYEMFKALCCSTVIGNIYEHPHLLTPTTSNNETK